MNTGAVVSPQQNATQQYKGITTEKPNVSVSPNYYATYKKKDTKDYITYDSIYMKCYKNATYNTADPGTTGLTPERSTETFSGDGNVLLA